jgi:formylglycine-generating enzyme required for sulfatase activity
VRVPIVLAAVGSVVTCSDGGRPPEPKSESRASPSPRAGEIRTNATDGLEYAYVPAGTAEVGCAAQDTQCFPEEKPRHRVTLTRGFWLGRRNVTARAYVKFASSTGRALPQGTVYTHGGSEREPASSLSWDDALAFCRWSGGRLPTEAEWEYAARGGEGEDTLYPWGNDYPWRGEPGPRPLDRPNRLGLYELTGVQAQWCSDWFDKDSYAAAPSADPAGPPSGEQRVLRGQSSGARQNPWILRISNRGRGLPGVPYAAAGVRCAREAVP